MSSKDLPRNERKILQYITIISVIIITYVFFVKQKIITAMLLGAAILIAQNTYLRRRTKKRS